jgi:hypothetical protein
MTEPYAEPAYDYPVDESLKVIAAKTVNKTAKWWSAVVKFESEYSKGPKIAVYLWTQKGEKWKRVQKLTILPSSWPQLRASIDDMVGGSKP